MDVFAAESVAQVSRAEEAEKAMLSAGWLQGRIYG